MEALAAFSVACNVFQLIEFGGRVLSESRQIYRSVEGATAGALTSDLVAKDLHHLVTTLRDSVHKAAFGQPLSADDFTLEKLGPECASVADELQGAVGNLTQDGARKKREALKLAVRSMNSRSKRHEIEGRLNSLRNEFEARIAIDMRYVCAQPGTVRVRRTIA